MSGSSRLCTIIYSRAEGGGVILRQRPQKQDRITSRECVRSQRDTLALSHTACVSQCVRTLWSNELNRTQQQPMLQILHQRYNRKILHKWRCQSFFLSDHRSSYLWPGGKSNHAVRVGGANSLSPANHDDTNQSWVSVRVRYEEEDRKKISTQFLH